MSGRRTKATDAEAAEQRRKAWNSRYPYAPAYPGQLPEYEPVKPRALDFEQRDVVDWSGYYPDGERAPDYE